MKKITLIIAVFLSLNTLKSQEVYTLEYFGNLLLEDIVKYTSDSLVLFEPYDKRIIGSSNYIRAEIYLSKYENGPRMVDIIFIGDTIVDHIQYVLLDYLMGFSSSNFDTDLYSAVVVGASKETWAIDNRGAIFEFNTFIGPYADKLNFEVRRVAHRYEYQFHNIQIEEVPIFEKTELKAEIDIILSMEEIRIKKEIKKFAKGNYK